MKNLGNLRPAAGSNKKTKRIGRGPGSGTGKTAGKGHKGQKARKGGGVAPGFEGGQTPLYRRLPKRGFTNLRNKKVYNCISLNDLNKFDDGATINLESLKQKGMIKKDRNPIKILANGKLERKVNIKVDKITAGAKSAIEGLGGSVA